MIFELTNEQRTYLGLNLVKDSWEKVQFNDQIYLYFDGDTIVKEISLSKNGYRENELDEKTENREIVLPKTKKGKPKKLNYTAISKMRGYGTYFKYESGNITIASYTSQTTFYSTHDEPVEIANFDELSEWLAEYINTSTDLDLEEINEFKNATRKRVKLKEGDFFRFRIGRRQYGFGRILLDVRIIKKQKDFKENKNYGLAYLSAQPLAISVYDIISPTKEVTLEHLQTLTQLPTQYVMDNEFFYGEHPIIGNKPLKDNELEFPIQHGRSISGPDPDTVYLQYGKIFKESHVSKFDKYLYMPNSINPDGEDIYNPFRADGIGFGINLNLLLKKESKFKPLYSRNLNDNSNKHIKAEIFNHFGLDPDLSYAENLKIHLKDTVQ